VNCVGGNSSRFARGNARSSTAAELEVRLPGLATSLAGKWSWGATVGWSRGSGPPWGFLARIRLIQLVDRLVAGSGHARLVSPWSPDVGYPDVGYPDAGYPDVGLASLSP